MKGCHRQTEVRWMKESRRSYLLEMDPRHWASWKERDVDKQSQQWRRDKRRLNVSRLVLISVCGGREHTKVLTDFPDWCSLSITESHQSVCWWNNRLQAHPPPAFQAAYESSSTHSSLLNCWRFSSLLIRLQTVTLYEMI